MSHQNWIPGEWELLGVRANRNEDFLRERCVGLATFLRQLLRDNLAEEQLATLRTWLVISLRRSVH